MEIMGGDGLCSKLAVRRRLKVGHNFDIVSGSDLRDPREQHALKSYVTTYQPFCVIMAHVYSFGADWALYQSYSLRRLVQIFGGCDRARYDLWYGCPYAGESGQTLPLRESASYRLAQSPPLAIGHELPWCHLYSDTPMYDRTSGTRRYAP